MARVIAAVGKDLDSFPSRDRWQEISSKYVQHTPPTSATFPGLKRLRLTRIQLLVTKRALLTMIQRVEELEASVGEDIQSHIIKNDRSDF